jgi:hypothetical protein
MHRMAKVLSAAVALVICEPLAQARVNIDIDLGSQTMRVAADSGETYIWPISFRESGAPDTHRTVSAAAHVCHGPFDKIR